MLSRILSSGQTQGKSEKKRAICCLNGSLGGYPRIAPDWASPWREWQKVEDKKSEIFSE